MISTVLSMNKADFLLCKIRASGKKDFCIGFGIKRDEFISHSQLNTNTVQRSWSNPIVEQDREIDSELTLFQLNDNHGKYKPLVRIKTAVDKIKEKLEPDDIPMLRIHAGDYNTGSDTELLNLQVKLLNNLRIDYATLGNHEFDATPKELARALENAHFKTVTSNLHFQEDSPLYRLTKTPEPVISTSCVAKINGHEFGIIGISPVDMPEILGKQELIEKYLEGVEIAPGERNTSIEERFNATANCIKKEVEKLKSQNVNKIILVSHSDFKIDKKIAEQVDGIDVIVGGHSHEKLDPFTDKNTVVMSPSNEPVLIFQSGQNGKKFTVADIAFDKNGVILEARGRIENTNDFEQHPQATKLVEQTLGYSPAIGTISRDYDNGKAKTEENAYANFVTDAMREYTGADIALLSGFTIRDDIDKGEITERDIRNTLSLSNGVNIIKRELPGEEIEQALNRGAYTFSKDNPRPARPGLLQVSGLKYTVVPEGLASDVLVQSNKENGEEEYEPMQKGKPYTVAYETTLQQGIEGFSSLTGDITDKDIVYKGENLADIVCKTIKKRQNSPLSFKVEGRITRK